MAYNIDYSALTLNPEEARSVNEEIFKEFEFSPELVNVHDIQTGVVMDTFIPILGTLGLVGKASQGGCASNDITDQIPVSQKKWEPKLIDGRMTICRDQIPALLKLWGLGTKAAAIWEDATSEEITFIQTVLLDAIKKSIIRHAEFGDKLADTVTNGGNLTDGTDKTYFNVINGMWTQIFADQAGSAVSHRYTITENGEATKVAQLTLATDRALKVFRDLYENIDPRAFGTDLKFQVTRSLMNNWEAFMEDKSQAFETIRTEDGNSKKSYRGIPIEVRYDWDTTIATYYDQGDTYYLPHRAILAATSNIPIGTSDTESFSELTSIYDQVTKKHYMDFAYRLDQKNLLEENLAVAY